MVDPAIISKPYFVSTNSSANTILELNNKFEILELYTTEGVNILSMTTIKVRIPSPLFGSNKASATTSKNTTETFFANQLFKHVTICWERSSKVYGSSKDMFPLKTYYHGLLTSAVIKVEPDFDVAYLELRPYLWLLTQQNRYRSDFDNQNAKQIITKVLTEYQKKIPAGKFVFNVSCIPEPKTRIQTIQMGETDFEFILRLLEEEGLSYFFHHDEKNVTLEITNKVAASLRNLASKSTVKKPLEFLTMAGVENVYEKKLEGLHMPLFDYTIRIANPITEIQMNGAPDYRDADAFVKQTADQKSTLYANAKKNFNLTRIGWIPTTQLVAFNKPDKEAFLKRLGETHLARNLSSIHTHSGRTYLKGFFQIWQECDITNKLDAERSTMQSNYKTAMPASEKFRAYEIRQKYIRIENFADPVSSDYYVEVDLKFLDVSNDTFYPQFKFPMNELVVPYQSFEGRKGTHSAVIAKFKDDDKTKNDYDVPNMFRIHFPWHQPNESVHARLSFFWASDSFGSTFLPEVGDEVLVSFINDDYNYPVIIGSCYNSKHNYPLDVAKRTPKAKFDARGILFKSKEKNKESTTKLLVEHGKDDQGDETQIFTLSTAEGTVATTGTKVGITATKRFGTTVTEPKTTMVMDDKTVAITALNDKGSLTIESGKMTAKSAEINLTGQSKVNASAPEIAIAGKTKVAVSGAEIGLNGNAKVSTSAATVEISGKAQVNVSGAIVKANSLMLPQ